MKRVFPKTLASGKGGESAKTPPLVIRYSSFIIHSLYYTRFFVFFIGGGMKILKIFGKSCENLGNFSLWSLKKGKKKFIIGKIDWEVGLCDFRLPPLFTPTLLRRIK